MSRLFSKDEDLTRSAPFIGSEILKELNESKDGRISIFDLAKALQSKQKTSARSIYYGMLFLYAIDGIDFIEPYVVKNVKD